ncbi:MarR family transcriptional regulator [Actinoallomurus sp. NPDC050550]|uniref:MarR family winged helix-turn-helix transcriptional regulator n=1 Tax=Actinoallomurus sp. NPDC050550 TaxID=3154937 RepID=UPI0034063F33
MATEESVTRTVSFLLGKLGQVATGRFAERLMPHGLRPRHCAVLEILAAGPKAQLELARTIGVTPSVVVDMLDELEELGALQRVRDTVDRRRHLIELTPTGQKFRRKAVLLAMETDEELLGGLSAEEAAALKRALNRVASLSGIPAAG